MATLSDTEMLHVGSGILMPKLKRRWRLLLPGVEDGEAVSRQVISISDVELKPVPHIRLSNFKMPQSNVWLKVEDDVQSSAMKVLYKLLNDQTVFDMVVDILDGADDVLEKRTFVHCNVGSISLDELNYASGGESQSLRIFCPEKLGNAIETFKEQYPELTGLFLALNGLSITWPIETGSSSQLIHTINVDYDSILIEYP